MSSYVVTGGRGIGLEFVNQLSAKPENVVFSLVRSLSSVPKLQALVKERPNLHAFEADITDLPALKGAAAEIAKITGGKLDVLINNAAFQEDKNTFGTMTTFAGREEDLVADLKESFNVNVIGVILTTNAFLPLLRAGSAKKVITLSTGMGNTDLTIAANADALVPYSISKAAVNMVVAKYAVDLKPEGFIFLALSPGLVNTALAPPTPDQLQGIIKMIVGLKGVYPEWDGNPITPEESVGKMLPIIAAVKPEQSGTMLSHHGNQQWC